MKSLIRFVVVAVAVGVLLGVFTSFGQTILSEPFTQLANSYSIWLFFSLVAGYLLVSAKQAAIAGALLQYIAILFYYVASSIRFDMAYTIENLISLNLIWIAGGTLAGPLAGVAGALIKQRHKYVPYAIGFMAGLFISEGLYQFLSLQYVGEGIVFIVTALLFLVVAYYKLKFPIVKTVLVTIAFSILMYVGFAYVLAGLF